MNSKEKPSRMEVVQPIDDGLKKLLMAIALVKRKFTRQKLLELQAKMKVPAVPDRLSDLSVDDLIRMAAAAGLQLSDEVCKGIEERYRECVDGN